MTVSKKEKPKSYVVLTDNMDGYEKGDPVDLTDAQAAARVNLVALPGDLSPATADTSGLEKQLKLAEKQRDDMAAQLAATKK